jgi:hypothetical protein
LEESLTELVKGFVKSGKNQGRVTGGEDLSWGWRRRCAGSWEDGDEVWDYQENCNYDYIFLNFGDNCNYDYIFLNILDNYKYHYKSDMRQVIA